MGDSAGERGLVEGQNDCRTFSIKLFFPPVEFHCESILNFCSRAICLMLCLKIMVISTKCKL